MSDKAERVSANAGRMMAAQANKLYSDNLLVAIGGAVKIALAIEAEVQKALRPKEKDHASHPTAD